jgi:DNA-binding NarL/FixJ family response regulator
MPRVLVFTAQPVLAAGFRRVLEDAGGELTAAGVCEIPGEFIARLGETRPEIAMLDAVTLPGAEFLIEARTVSARSHLVLWAEEVSIKIVRQAFEFGVRGVISGKSAPGPLVAALLRIARGELYFPDLYCTPGELAGTALGPRERELVALIAQGLKNKEIASIMRLTEGTVKVYLTRLYQRLNVADRFELALFGLGAFFRDWGEPAHQGRRAAAPYPSVQSQALRRPGCMNANAARQTEEDSAGVPPSGLSVSAEASSARLRRRRL